MWSRIFFDILEKHKLKRSVHDEVLSISKKSLLCVVLDIWCFIYMDVIRMTSPFPQVLNETVEVLKKHSPV